MPVMEEMDVQVLEGKQMSQWVVQMVAMVEEVHLSSSKAIEILKP